MNVQKIAEQLAHLALQNAQQILSERYSAEQRTSRVYRDALIEYALDSAEIATNDRSETACVVKAAIKSRSTMSMYAIEINSSHSLLSMLAKSIVLVARERTAYLFDSEEYDLSDIREARRLETVRIHAEIDSQNDLVSDNIRELFDTINEELAEIKL
jgi:hypothetical protein